MVDRLQLSERTSLSGRRSEQMYRTKLCKFFDLPLQAVVSACMSARDYQLNIQGSTQAYFVSESPYSAYQRTKKWT